MIVHILEVNKDLFHPKEDNEELFGLKVPYLNAISIGIYLINFTRSYVFFVSLLERYGFIPTRKH